MKLDCSRFCEFNAVFISLSTVTSGQQLRLFIILKYKIWDVLISFQVTLSRSSVPHVINPEATVQWAHRVRSPSQNIPVNVRAVSLTSASLAHTLCLSLRRGVYYTVAHIAHQCTDEHTHTHTHGRVLKWGHGWFSGDMGVNEARWWLSHILLLPRSPDRTGT